MKSQIVAPPPLRIARVRFYTAIVETREQKAISGAANAEADSVLRPALQECTFDLELSNY